VILEHGKPSANDNWLTTSGTIGVVSRMTWDVADISESNPLLPCDVVRFLESLHGGGREIGQLVKGLKTTEMKRHVWA
jgi:hypothetical protein